MLLIVVCFQLLIQVLSEVPPPQNIHVDNWHLTWTRAAGEDRNVSYTVQYSSFDNVEWTDFPACVRIASNSCDVASTKHEDRDGCVKFRVLAETPGLKSTAVEACSQHGDRCAPKVSHLTAKPGLLTINLSRDNQLVKEHQDHITHRVFYGKEGEPLEAFTDDFTLVDIGGLQEGQRYCARVQYMRFSKPTGPPSCAQCALIPETKSETKAEVIVGAVVACAIVFSVTVVALYFAFYHCDRIKRWMRPPCEIPPHFLLDPQPGSLVPVSPEEERCELLYVIRRE